jgi:hypothetical protein
VLIDAAETDLVKEQDLPANARAKVAVPDANGVPEIFRTKFPFPLFKVPEAKEAVRPVTPVELTEAAL